MSCSESRLKRTRVSTWRWRNVSFGVTRHTAGVDAMIAAGEQPQALRRLIEQFRLRQDAAADGDDGVGGEDVGAFELLIDAHHGERGVGLGAREPRRAGARQLAALRRLVDVGGTQRVGLDAGLIDQRQPARRAGSKHEFWTADHLNR
jgi:hypothetical protein